MHNKPHTKEAKRKMRLAHKGHIPWNKGKKTGLVPKTAFKKGQRGRKCINWKGGRTKDRKGYVFIYIPKHPFANNKGYVREHRLIIEKRLGQYLKPEYDVHHLNDKKDDNKPKNLMAFNSRSAHQRFHHNPGNVKPEEIIFDGRHS